MEDRQPDSSKLDPELLALHLVMNQERLGLESDPFAKRLWQTLMEGDMADSVATLKRLSETSKEFMALQVAALERMFRREEPQPGDEALVEVAGGIVAEGRFSALDYRAAFRTPELVRLVKERDRHDMLALVTSVARIVTGKFEVDPSLGTAPDPSVIARSVEGFVAWADRNYPEYAAEVRGWLREGWADAVGEAADDAIIVGLHDSLGLRLPPDLHLAEDP